MTDRSRRSPDADVVPLRPDTEGELLRALHEEHAGALWAYALQLTGGDRARAEDVVQETLLRAWRRPEVLGQLDRSARSWLFTVARNIVVDEWRAAQRRPLSLPGEMPDQGEPDGADAALESLLVTQALRRLSAEHRAVLLECYYRGCTAVQAAHRLGVPVGTVKSRLHYGLHALRLSLQELGVVT